MTRKPTVKIEDLVVADFPSAVLVANEGMREWRTERNIPYSMSCARQVWYGHAADFTDFPSDADKRIVMREGAEAYAFLLSFASGFEGKHYSTHNRHQFFKAWQDMQRTLPISQVATYRQFMRDIELDSALVQNVITNHYRDPEFNLAARDLSGQKKGERVLIIGNLSGSGNLSDTTLKLIQGTETRQKQQRGHNDYITVTHPDAAVLQQIEAAINYIKKNPSENAAIRSNITYVPFFDLTRAVEGSERVYVTMDMGSQYEAEQHVIGVWQHRLRRDNTITHMKGNPQKQGQSDEPWKSAGLDNYISPEDIRAEVQHRHQMKKLIWQNAQEAFAVCASLRSQGIHPDKGQLRDLRPDLTPE